MRGIVLIGAALALAACSGGGGLRDLRTDTGGPDEFSVVPGAPLELPETLTLPPPTPGGTNRTDAAPKAAAIAALGGSPAAAFAGGIPANDQALVAHAGRNGLQSDIRAVLATEDAAFRARRARLNTFNLLGTDQYFRAYARQSLDAYAELNRFRAAGVQTPTAPPR
ncbi:Beta-barrel assembly machine subunit BamF [Cognatiyoonia koreensis]|uniref:Beta-barrel assembly machine subunit BamF n=1 Tax=Cognatiyoonia koreensis TaxID=364200 RepID=A0A1I0RV37_9RHOB|nr:DUF3035 domain-containing protein [Cognatiyoonia koreensis]SEW45252.1 Beta-barrel assembly machine subunit BamF [Cognatiyoonia koreensis]